MGGRAGRGGRCGDGGPATCPSPEARSEAAGPWWATLEAAVPAARRKGTTPCELRGSWDPIDAWGAPGGRVYATALPAATLALRD
jgi:hypothetical protein